MLYVGQSLQAVMMKVSNNESDNTEVAMRDGGDVETGDTMTDKENVGDSTDCAEEAYCTTKAMGDADRQVCLKSIVQARRK
jgi:hypothetical protein